MSNKLVALAIMLFGLVGCKGGNDPCEGGPNMDNWVITGFAYEGAVHHPVEEIGTEDSGSFTQITLDMITALAKATPAPRTLEVSLFAKAAATSCSYPLPERITAITITSNADYHHQDPAGLPLNHLFHFGFRHESLDETLAQGPQVVSGMPLVFVLFEQPTASLQHQFTFEIELDSGSRFTLVTDTVEFESAAIE